jgi:hypothetical protein
LNDFIKKYVSVLSGFDWGRVWFFNRVLWYIIFALCLTLLMNVNISKCPSFFPRVWVHFLILLQLVYITLSPVKYNDPITTWFNEVVVKTGIAKKLRPNSNFNSFVSYKEFYAKDLFTKIKYDISYSDEMVVAFGYEPSVLMYNGFNCIDGYNNAYPLSYMQRFRNLIAPELEVNQSAREYYDEWGGRMYLYNSDLNYGPTRDKNTSPVHLNINMDVFKNDFNGKYILSRTEISNSGDLGLNLVKQYYDNESIYTIYVYQAVDKNFDVETN